MNWMDYMSNPRGFAVKRYMAEVLNERYPQHEPLLERLGMCITTNKDLEAFNRLVADIYESAYMKAVNDHREALAKVGLQANVVAGQAKAG